MSERSIIFAGSNTSGTGRIFVEVAQAMGLRPVLLSSRDDDYGLSEVEGLRILDVDPLDAVAAIKAVRSGAAEYPVVAVATSSELCVPSAAQLARALGLPGPCPESVRLCRDKSHQRRVFDEAALASPRWCVASTVAEARSAVAEIGLPVCVKPLSSSGSMGVRLVHVEDDVEAAAGAALDCQGSEAQILVEELVVGPEYSVEVFDRTVVGVTTTKLGGCSGTLEVAHVFPAPIADAAASSLGRTAIAAIEALGLGFGPAHVELRMTRRGPQLIEVNPRLAGGMIPELVRRALGIDLIRATLARACGSPPDLESRCLRSSAIAFAIADEPGTVVGPERPESERADVDVGLLRPPGTFITPRGDFRDRFGFAIAEGDDGDTVLRRAEEAAHHLSLVAFEGQHSTGMLRRPLRPAVRELVFGASIQASDLGVLSRFAAIDQAHLVMQAEQGIADAPGAGRVLREIRALERNRFEDLIGLEPVRGLYLAYESYLAERVDDHAAQTLHVARSRNDINATEHRIFLRECAAPVLDQLLDLLDVLLQRNARHGHAVMPLYTQHLVAAPGVLGHWLLAVATALVRDAEWFDSTLSALDCCPLGAVAVAGTDLPIDAERTARLLGFTDTISNALDAVASRDAGLRMTSAAAVMAVTLGRMASDLQAWARPEIGLVRFPDELVGSSSVLPQKRNHFLLEHVQSGASSSLGAFVSACLAQQATPFTNAVAVSTESTRHLPAALADLERVLVLGRECVSGFELRESVMRDVAGSDDALAPLAAELLRRHAGLSLRDAHREIGRLLRERDARTSLPDLLRGWARDRGLSAQSIHIDDLSPNSANDANCGGGPGRKSRRSQARALRARVSDLRSRQAERVQRISAARAELDDRVRSLIRESESLDKWPQPGPTED